MTVRSFFLVFFSLGAFGALIAACPGQPDVRPDPDLTTESDAGVAPIDAGVVDPPADAGPSRPALEPVAKPEFDPDAPALCASHTACYLSAKEAHATGERAGYLLALKKCEYYRGRYQLEKFYGMCLLLLGDAYRHLDNFEESSAAYLRFVDAQSDEGELALQAQASLDEVKRGKKTPFVYHDYLAALSLLTRYGLSEDATLLQKAVDLLEAVKRDQPDWFMMENVDHLLVQISGLLPKVGPIDGGPTDAGPTDAGPTDAGPTDAGPAVADPAGSGKKT
jgi:hypothetical protein